MFEARAIAVIKGALYVGRRPTRKAVPWEAELRVLGRRFESRLSLPLTGRLRAARCVPLTLAGEDGGGRQGKEGEERRHGDDGGQKPVVSAHLTRQNVGRG